MRHIEALLRQGIGLDAASIGAAVIERTVRRRMKWHGLKLTADYEQMLRQSPEEFDELIEAIVVTETWFFRDRAPFHAFTRIATEGQPPERTMRLLSVPCASGEEPFSLAMSLLDAEVAPERFQIDALDISQNALARATRAVYGKNSFRGADLEFRDRHFHPVQDGFAINPALRQQVRFQRANILDADFLTDTPPYDFIFCRNLLIYLDRVAQRLTLEKLQRLLAADGVLFVGPAELPLATACGFVSAGWPHAFACRKAEAQTQNQARPARRSHSAAHPTTAGTSHHVTSPPKTSLRKTQPDIAALHHARRLADNGQLDAAAALCQAHLAQHPDCAECYYLLGLVKDAGDDPQAIEFYRKALYLDPAHYESLAHTAFWLEKHGDAAGAQPFKRRMARVARQRQVALSEVPNP